MWKKKLHLVLSVFTLVFTSLAIIDKTDGTILAEEGVCEDEDGFEFSFSSHSLTLPSLSKHDWACQAVGPH